MSGIIPPHDYFERIHRRRFRLLLAMWFATTLAANAGVWIYLFAVK